MLSWVWWGMLNPSYAVSQAVGRMVHGTQGADDLNQDAPSSRNRICKTPPPGKPKFVGLWC